ncbi:MAG: helix-turn-helix domain-containing protein [Elusimicrobia bacterium]|nr:helix-turn-helix domain-containing protein [Elusimicrobiota bacterium]
MAEKLRLTPYTIREWARLGRLPSIRLTHRIRFDPKDLEKWLKERRWLIDV